MTRLSWLMILLVLGACQDDGRNVVHGGTRGKPVFTRQECLFIYPPANLIYVAMRQTCLALSGRPRRPDQ